MKEIPLTRGFVALVDDDDYEWAKEYKWFAVLDEHACYAARSSRKDEYPRFRHVQLHRQIMQAPDGLDVDHINGNGLDCRKENLRICTRAQNVRNRRVQPHSSQYKGVSRHKTSGAYLAHISVDGQDHHLGFFRDEKAAAQAYNEAAQELFGEFAKLNMLKEGTIEYGKPDNGSRAMNSITLIGADDTIARAA